MKQNMFETETKTATPQLKIMDNFINYIIYSNGKIYNCKKDCFCKTERKDKSRYQEVRMIDNQGYYHTFYVHFLIASNFIGEIPEGMQINHINENKHDNRLENLEIVTPAQNCAHGTRNERIAKSLKGKAKQHYCFKVEDLNNPDEVEVFDCLASFLKQYPSQKRLTWQYRLHKSVFPQPYYVEEDNGKLIKITPINEQYQERVKQSQKGEEE